MKRLAIISASLLAIAGIYLSYNHQLEADDGPTATSTSTAAAITLSKVAINLSPVLKDMLGGTEEEGATPTAPQEPPISISDAIAKNFGITPQLAEILDIVGDFKFNNSDNSDAQLVIKYINNEKNPLILPGIQNIRPIEELLKINPNPIHADLLWHIDATPTLNTLKAIDKLQVKLLWQIAAAQVAHMLNKKTILLNQLEKIAASLGTIGYSLTNNPYAPFAAEVFRQYWLFFKKEYLQTMLDHLTIKDINRLERISKLCFHDKDPRSCLFQKLDANKDANIIGELNTYPFLLPTFFTFGVPIQETLDHNWTIKIEQGNLNLESKHINSLDGLQKIEGLESLEKLHLDNNQIKTIPAKMEGLRSLEYLILNNNQIKTIPAKIEELRSLRYLSLNNNQIKTIPAKIEGLRSLRYLYLNNNQISAIPAKIEGLGSLWYLHLNNNQISAIPAKIAGLESLEQLYLENNQISTIPTKIAGLESLEQLYLENNQISTIPAKIEGLGSLVSLRLNKNQISAIPAGKWGLPANVVISI